MYHLVCLLLGAYVALRAVWPLPIPRVTRIVVVSVVMFAAMNRWVCLLVFGDMFSPEVPGAIIWIVGAMFGTVLLLAVMTLLGDLVALVTLMGFGSASAASILRRWRPAAIAAAMFFSLVGAWNGSKVPEVRHVRVAIHGLPAELEGFKLVQLSDLHVSPLLNNDWLDQVVKRTNELHPQLIVITGDFIDGTVADRTTDVRALAQLRAPAGVVGSLGNHEYYFHAQEWKAHLTSLGIKVLENQHVAVPYKGRVLLVAATTDEEAIRHGQEAPSTAKALASAPASDAVVLLRHRPTAVDEADRLGVDLQLSGHTHGGMVWGLDRLVANANDGLVSGLYQRGRVQVYVNNGTGIWNGFLIRLGRPSEVTEIELVGAR